MTGWPGERTVRWQRSEKQASYASPVAATINGQRHIFCLMRQGLVSLNPTNGGVNFSFWFRSRANDSVNAACPVVVDDLVFISAAYYKVSSFSRVSRIEGIYGQGVANGFGSHWNTPVFQNGFLYAFSGRNEPDARFRCVEFKTGNVMWDRDESWQHGAQTSSTYGRGSAILADGKLIALGEAGFLGLWKLNSKVPEEICRAQIASLHHPCWAAPVLSEKRLFLRSEDRLLCLDLARR